MLLSATTIAQIKIFNGGLNSYGTLTQPTGNTRHLINGNIRFDNWTDVLLDWQSGWCCGTPTLYPEKSWYFQLGNSTHFLGDAYITHLMYKLPSTKFSDSSIKLNINYNLATFANFKQLRPVSFKFKDTFFSGLPQVLKDSFCGKIQYGFIAQDVLSIFPELVELDTSTGLLGINYDEFIPLIIDGIKNQQYSIDSLREQYNILVNEYSMLNTQYNNLLTQYYLFDARLDILYVFSII
jgi:hypothetical protein